MDKSTIKYLIELSPDKRLMAGMMVIIIFLASERAVKEVKDTKYRNAKENQIINMERDNSLQTIKYYNHLIDEETIKQSKYADMNEKLRKIDSILTSLERKIKK